MDEAVFTAMKAQYGRVAVVAFSPDLEIVIRAPNRGEYRVCRAMMHNAAQAPDAQEDLVRKLVVWCNGVGSSWKDALKEFDALLNTYPGLCENRAASAEISEFTGIAFREQGKA